jgi:hypothetical protein
VVEGFECRSEISSDVCELVALVGALFDEPCVFEIAEPVVEDAG